MTDAEATGLTPVARGVRWLRTVPETLALCAVLFFVYAVELLVLATAGGDAFSYWFVAGTTPSPGWLLSPVAHSPFDPFHLVSNLALLVVFGGMAERRLSRSAYLVLLAAAGLGGVAGQLFWYAVAPATAATPGTLGASAAALAATSFAVVDSARRRRAAGRWAGETTWVWTLFGGAVLARRLVLDLAVGVPDVGRYGHLWGVLFGAACALLWRTTRSESE